ncbi:hypothetical protein NM897_09195 [Planococcus maritimus]|uniref:hypothetical protein n=1 Tax=Planococcus maritimus TaxID=192421 RepID=UPI0031393C1B
MRRRDYFLTFESENDEEAARIRALYFKMIEAIGNPDRIAYGTEHEKLDVLNDDEEIICIEYTGKVFHRIDIYCDELINRRKR